MPKCHNAGIWSTDLKILRFMFKTYSSSSSLVITSRRFSTSHLVAPKSVRLVYCWSLRCSWSIACQRCCNYIFILHLTLGFNILHKDNCKPRWETFKFSDLVQLVLEILRYIDRLVPARDHISMKHIVLIQCIFIGHTGCPWMHILSYTIINIHRQSECRYTTL